MIRSHIHTYPEDRRGKSHKETWHFKKWGNDISPNLACPMVRAPDGQDYFVYEPALIDRHGSPVAVMPIRWFLRDGKMFAMAHDLVSDGKGGYWVDGYSEPNEISLTQFVFSVTKFEKNYATYGLPNPLNVNGE
jgi:hypothetical protein